MHVSCRMLLIILPLMIAPPVLAQAYKWVDERGVTHYSQEPSESIKSRRVETEPFGVNTDDQKECHTIKCQGERLDAAKAREAKEQEAARQARAEYAGPRVRGLTFFDYIRIQRGMTEGEVLVRAGPPDYVADESASTAYGVAGFGNRFMQPGSKVHPHIITVPAYGLIKTFYYFPTDADPFITRIIFSGGRVFELERIRKF